MVRMLTFQHYSGPRDTVYLPRIASLHERRTFEHLLFILVQYGKTLREKHSVEFVAPRELSPKALLPEERWRTHMETRSERPFDPTAKPLWQIAEEIAKEIPDEEWAKLPTDLSANLKHYLYGAPKRSNS